MLKGDVDGIFGFKLHKNLWAFSIQLGQQAFDTRCSRFAYGATEQVATGQISTFIILVSAWIVMKINMDKTKAK